MNIDAKTALEVMGERIKIWTTRANERIGESRIAGELSYRFGGAILIDNIEGRAKQAMPDVQERLSRYPGWRLACTTKGAWIALEAIRTGDDWASKQIIEVQPGGEADELIGVFSMDDIIASVLVFGAYCEARLEAGLERHSDDLESIASFAEDSALAESAMTKTRKGRD